MLSMHRTFKFYFSLVTLLILASSMAGYSQSNPTSKPPSQKVDEPKKLNIAMAGIGVGGAWASIGEGVLECIRRSYPGSTASYEAGQEGPNVALVSSGKLQIGIANGQLVQMAYEGTGPFNKRKMENVRVLAMLYEDVYFQFLVNKKTGIKRIEDIKRLKYPLKINFNTKGSFMQIAGEQVLNAYGITESDIKSWGGRIGYMSTGDSIDQMRDSVIEAYITTTQVPLSNFVDAALTMDLALLPVNDEIIEKLKITLYTTKGVIPKKTYTFVDQEIPTLKSECILFVNSKISDAEAYAITKAISNNINYLKGIHPSLKSLTVKGLATIKGKVPFHPGAELFYKEKGVF